MTVTLSSEKAAGIQIACTDLKNRLFLLESGLRSLEK